MTEQIGRIEKKDNLLTKTGGEYSCYTIDGKKYNVFDEKWLNFKVGDTVNYTLELKGKFQTITKMENAQNSPVSAPKTAVKGEFHLSPEQVRTNALDLAYKISPGMSLNKEQLFAFAEEIALWLIK